MTAANGIDHDVGAAQTMLRRCAANVAAAFTILLRPARRTQNAWPMTGRQLAIGAGAALALFLVVMVLFDAAMIRAVGHLPSWLVWFFDQITDFGKSGWFLWPLGILFLVLAALPSLPRVPQLVLSAIMVRVGFLFAAIAAPSLFDTIIKRMIGRARPLVGGSLDPYLFSPFKWTAEYASLPSGHATTAFAVVVAFGTLWPRARTVLWVYALLIAVSRVVLTAHYPSDVLAAAAVGVVGRTPGAPLVCLARPGFFHHRRTALFTNFRGRRCNGSNLLPARCWLNKKHAHGRPADGTLTMNANDPAVSVVVPVRNEAGNIEPLVKEIAQALDGQWPFEVVYVNDGSSDGTEAELRRLMAQYPWLRHLRHKQSCGQSAAVRSGVATARAPLIVTLDGDGQNDPAFIPAMLRALEAGAPRLGLIAGQRVKRKSGGFKKLQSRIANAVRGMVLRDGTRDTGCGLKAFRRDVFLRLPYFDGLHRFLPALVKREGCAIGYVDVVDRPRGAGVSNYGMWDRLWIGILDLAGVWWLIRRKKRVPEIVED